MKTAGMFPSTWTEKPDVPCETLGSGGTKHPSGLQPGRPRALGAQDKQPDTESLAPRNRVAASAAWASVTPRAVARRVFTGLGRLLVL